MRIAVVSDIHGNLGALSAVMDDIAKQGVDRTMNLGDILSGPLCPTETADLLMTREVVTIRGNHERQLLTMPIDSMGASDRFARERLSNTHLDWLRSLPAEIKLDGNILLTHGAPGDDLQYLLETVDTTGIRVATEKEIASRLNASRHSLILCGHSHVPRCVQLPDGRLVVNPGSIGLQAYDDVNPFPHVIQTGSPEARYAIIERVGNQWSVELRKVAYDNSAAADLALRNGRADWATALRTGQLR